MPSNFRDTEKRKGKLNNSSAVYYENGEPIDIFTTKETMVKDCLSIIPFKYGQKVLDVGSGKNKVWFKNIPNMCIPFEYELEEGKDFLQSTIKMDWCLGNIPFNLGYTIIEYTARNIAQVGFAYLLNAQGINSLTPRRRQILADLGFWQQQEFICGDKRWFGRYHFVVFTKEPNSFWNWNTRTY